MDLVSVIVPSYNESDSITDAIDSVLSQTHSELELIVVDDCSTDDTPEVIRGYSDGRITYIRHGENQGAAAARNTGIRQAEGEYIALLDADDTWHPTKLEKQVACLRSRSDEWIAVYCNVEYDSLKIDGLIRKYIVSNEPNRGIEGSDELVRKLITGDAQVAAGSTLLAKSEYVERIGGFDEAFVRHQDWEFLIRLLEHGKCAYVDEKLATIERLDSPPAEKEYEAKAMFLEKFSDKLADHPLSAQAIENKHRFQLSRQFIENGQFRRGYEVLPELRSLTITNYLGIAISTFKYLSRSL